MSVCADARFASLTSVLLRHRIPGADRTVILTGIMEWGAEILPGQVAEVIPFEAMFDLEAVARSQPVVLLTDHLRGGWNGQVDEMVLLLGAVS